VAKNKIQPREYKVRPLLSGWILPGSLPGKAKGSGKAAPLFTGNLAVVFFVGIL
jgi:hypothetical protein